jgi:hypothetical protein
MKKLLLILIAAVTLAACEKADPVATLPGATPQTEPEYTNWIPKITPHVKVLRRNTSLRFTVSVIFVAGCDSTAWLAYELPKVNSAFNPHAPYVRLPEGYYAFGRIPQGMLVDGWAAGDCFYSGGNSWLQIVPRGGKIFQFVCWKKNQTQTLYDAAAAQALYDRLPDTGVLQFY